MAEEMSGPGRDWEKEPSGEADRDEEECRDGERGRQPGMATGAEPPRQPQTKPPPGGMCNPKQKGFRLMLHRSERR